LGRDWSHLGRDWVLSRRGGGREHRALIIVALAFGLILTVNFMHIHPGTRALLHLVPFAPLFFALGLEKLRSLPSLWRRTGWLMLAALLTFAVLPWASSMNALRADWSGSQAPRFTEIAQSLPNLEPSEAVRQVRLWAGDRPINILVDNSGVDLGDQSLGPMHGEQQANYFGQPGVLGSVRFDQRPTLYFAAPADFQWTTALQRDFFIRADHAFTLLPAFRIGEKWLVFVAGLSSAPPEPWTLTATGNELSD
jgi:hypothetical protein